jgi:hypothetical protein
VPRLGVPPLQIFLARMMYLHHSTSILMNLNFANTAGAVLLGLAQLAQLANRRIRSSASAVLVS